VCIYICIYICVRNNIHYITCTYNLHVYYPFWAFTKAGGTDLFCSGLMHKNACEIDHFNFNRLETASPGIMVNLGRNHQTFASNHVFDAWSRLIKSLCDWNHMGIITSFCVRSWQLPCVCSFYLSLQGIAHRKPRKTWSCKLAIVTLQDQAGNIRFSQS